MVNIDFWLDRFPKIKSVKFSNTVDKTKPTVFTDIMSNWPAFGKWTIEFFKSRYGGRIIIAERMIDGNLLSKSYSLSEFLSYASNNDDQNPYHVRTELHLADNLQNDYDGTLYFPCWYRQWHKHYSIKQKIQLSDIFIGPKRSKSHLHVDIWGTSFWNGLFEGKKFWLFFDADQEQYLYNGAVHPFNPYLTEYPEYIKAKPTIWIQQPGELIYCPGNVYHAVYTLETSLALSENFIDEINCEFVLDSLRKQGLHNAFKKMQSIRRHFQQGHHSVE